MNKKFAFTLTEVMVAVGVVGIIAAMTVPTLMNNYQKRANAVQLRKVLNEVAAAADMYVTEEGKTHLKHTNIYSSKNNVNAFIRSKLKISKECASANTSECFASNYNSIDRTASGAFSCGGVSFLLTNSAAICAYEVSSASSYVKFYIDINGNDRPNIGGRDMFMFYLSGDANVVPHLSGTVPGCTNQKFGDGCFYQLSRNNWETNY